jgi:transcriptional regulator with XRE-family HTH domain
MVRGKSPTWVNVLRLTFARNVRLARERAGLSQRDLCGTTGISQAYLSQVENGRWNVGLDNIAKIAVAVGVAPHDLLDPSFGKEGRDSPADSKATGQRKP